MLFGLGDLGEMGVAAPGGFEAGFEAVQGGLVAAAFFFGLAGGFSPGFEGAAPGGLGFEPVLGCALLGGEVLPFGVDALQLSGQPVDGVFFGDEGGQDGSFGAKTLLGGFQLAGVQILVFGQQVLAGGAFGTLGTGVVVCGCVRGVQQRCCLLGTAGLVAALDECVLVRCLFLEQVELLPGAGIGGLLLVEFAGRGFEGLLSAQVLLGRCGCLECPGVVGVTGAEEILGPGAGGFGERVRIVGGGHRVLGFQVGSGGLVDAFGQAQYVGAGGVAVLLGGAAVVVQPALDEGEATGAEEFSEEFSSAVGVGVEELGEFVLRQQDDLAELIPAHA
ncbi:hypothetical protein ACFY8P_23045 [Streptomyces sp. NPDC012693]|uniref:hypothetical protein n=1 Tax=Streptomyces sp. NPDC012693 TaxID=3364844 RepID=UPI00367F97DB